MLPFVDRHQLAVSASADRTWSATERCAVALSQSQHRLMSLLLGTVPTSGFEITAMQAGREITLAGRHRFATYQLVFRVTPDSDRVHLAADTYALFPGLRGRLYRAVLMHSGGHRFATRRMLRRIQRRAEGRAPNE